MKIYVRYLVLGGALGLAAPTFAQAPEGEARAEAPAIVDDATDARLGKLEALIAAQKARLDALDAQDEASSAKIEQLEGQLETAEEERMELMAQLFEAEDTGDKLFSIFGFMDAAFGHYTYRDNDLLSTFVIPEPTFVTSNINIYFKSQITSKLSTLIETRFTFAPNGEEISYPTVVTMGGQEVARTGEYVRGNSVGTDRLTSAVFDWGGVVIERAHIDYDVFEWLKLRLGRFLTPYGIWNVDHGSPVLIGTSLPQMVATQIIPNNLTGLQIHGRVFPTDRMRLDYAAFVTNGRGPTEEVYDLDANKALGARAKLSLRFGEVEASIGGFGYMGSYTDSRQAIRVQATPDFRPDFEGEEHPVGTVRTITEEYDEASIAADFDIRAYGFRLFGEGVIRKVTYDVRPEQRTEVYLAEGGRLGGSARAPDNIEKAGYLMLTYDVPLGFIKDGMFVRPWIGIERIERYDTTNVFNYSLYRLGLNVHPNPYMVWKLNAVNFRPDRGDVLGDFWGLTTQVAVAF